MVSRLDTSRYTFKRNGQDVILYKGLLALAHDKWASDGFDLGVEYLQLPHPDNGMTAVVKAKLHCPLGSFVEIGDASPDNVGRNIVPHIIRMAATRAKARALRDALNIGAVSIEELGQEDTTAADAGEDGLREDPGVVKQLSEVQEMAREHFNDPSRAPKRAAEGRPPQVEGFHTPEQVQGNLEAEGERPILTAQVRIMRDLLDKRAKEKEVTLDSQIKSFEKHMGKQLDQLTYGEANYWIEKMVPANPDDKDPEKGPRPTATQ